MINNEPELNKDTTYFFVGIKGTGMSAMALVVHDMGCKVEGSDIEKYTFTQKGLEDEGISVYPFNPDNIKPGMTLIVGNAFKDDQPEVVRAKEMGLPVYRYPEFLEELIKNFTSIAVCGAHGKTSTSGLLAHVLSGIAPTDYLVGDGTGNATPDARFFVYEADEYRRHFMPTYPDYAIMTNIDFDHPDYYKGIDDVFDAFQTFASHVKKGIFAWGDDPYLRKIEADVPVYYYGTKEKDDFRATDIKRTTTGSTFNVVFRGKNLGRFEIPLFGEHNVLNTLAVIAVAYFEEVDLDEIKRELLTFKGVKRRFSQIKIGDMTIIDDYAHHPSEIKATLDAARQEYPNKEIIVVFQPHTFSRTIAYLDDFAKTLGKADKVFVTKIYGSPREKSGHVTSQDLVDKIDNGNLISEDNMSPLLDYKNAVIIFMGAGDIQKYERTYEELLSHLSKKVN
ncbi:UDP-N-acetylmuramate--L-alanine ligase [Fructilactobacillus lindneri]|uniref:UDP-N-acetylmuramate--L-alanine ligase n=1 Tax=Fructilactobacillus lindneri DSM 20690 = JCM 11027 TaxID=1122148 RepID=A0A0R2JPN1_9LACO|nr:UDP-N-acetylmuramate--L-alanine ligase [Fructilactobacillus lindneri]ANZ58277.1 UDP-N-acetylmuramate--L-alanine ligase [Fructilactobacillus lindneri]KRN79104.1 UDP-N-acetylmuramate--L-alanine ligase [Fructilactobacillus lindneri DSM 20690 = JCM 11027]POG98617.1 UDP-N-acetylmuramate--L-alanine ligase [Fructilactobacillus lindneri]POH07753.1 UDP-N-acetylmuramate--L-alanine ligase [Fructilactobacillus lindneri]POH08827.1 UDP-N-acetylmuramate--L-alanine ligase [Fructilactobacillus lindneri]